MHGNYVENVTLAINKVVNFPKVIPKKIIYVSRSKAKYRKLVNELELIKMLKKNGVEIYNFDNISLTEQIKIAKETRVFISIHGAALTNMLFMNKSQNILEIRHPNSEIQNCYFSLASTLMHNYFYFLGTPIKKESNPHDGNLKVDVESFENLLKTIV
jgi:capsular polysaccharide biosynthesis protein